MPRKPKDITADIDAILARADQDAAGLSSLPLDDPPPHMLTAKQWAKRWNIARNTASDRLDVLIREKGWVSQKYRIRCPHRESYPVPHYGPGDVH